MLRHKSYDFPDITDESHIEHAVGFIQDKGRDLRKIDVSASHEIQKTSGRCDQNVAARQERVNLRSLFGPAVDTYSTQFQISAVFLEVIKNLDCQLSGWRNDKRADAPRLLIFEHGQNRQSERRCLSGSRLCAGNQIMSL